MKERFFVLKLFKVITISSRLRPQPIGRGQHNIIQRSKPRLSAQVTSNSKWVHISTKRRESSLLDNLVLAHSGGRSEERRIEDIRVGPSFHYEDRDKGDLGNLP